jgi:hypothetical protein
VAPRDDERNPDDENVASPSVVLVGTAHSPLPALAQDELLAPYWYMGWSQLGAYPGVTPGMYIVEVHVPGGGVVG